MKRHLPIILVAVAALVAILAAGMRHTRRVSESLRHPDAPTPSRAAKTVRFVKNPDPVPDFSVPDLTGHTISPAEYRGKVVLLNFWATWCPPCREEVPDLIELQSKFQGRLQIIGLSMDEGPADEVQRFVRQTKINYPVAIVNSGFASRFGGVAGLPTSFVIDREGRVVQKHVGLRDPNLYDMEVRALLGMTVDANVEKFDDTGQVLLTNAKRATELPGVDFSKLNAQQKDEALKRLNSEKCPCGCRLTLAQCRINDTTCPVSLKRAQEVVNEVQRGHAPRS